MTDVIESRETKMTDVNIIRRFLYGGNAGFTLVDTSSIGKDGSHPRYYFKVRTMKSAKGEPILNRGMRTFMVTAIYKEDTHRYFAFMRKGVGLPMSYEVASQKKNLYPSAYEYDNGYGFSEISFRCTTPMLEKVKMADEKGKSHVLAFKAMLRELKNTEWTGRFEFFHWGKCGVCGRTLKTPNSIQTGIGPVCIDL